MLVQNAWQAFAPMAALLFAYQGDLMSKLVAAGILLGVGSVFVSLLQYWFFRYRITGESVLIRTGVIQKKQLDIKFTRIQGINTAQNIIYRPLGLVNVSFDTAGSSGSEGTLPAIRAQLAEQLHSRIAAVESEAPASEAVVDSLPDPVLLQLDWRDMLRIGLSDRRALVVLAVLGPLFEQMGDAGERIISEYALKAASRLEQFGAMTGVLIVVALVVAVIVVLAVASIVAAFLRYHGFVLTQRGDRLQTVGGLLTQHTNSMDVSKIQLLNLKQSMLLRLFGRWRAVMRQATSSGKQSAAKSMVLPVIEPAFGPQLLPLAYGDELAGLDLDPRSPQFSPISAYYLRPRIIMYGVLPAVFLMLVLWPNIGTTALLALLWPLLVALAVFLIWRRYGFQVHDNGLVHRSGFVGFDLEVFVFRKVQRVTVSQSWLQRRKGLAGMRIYLASGSVRLRYIDHALACRLRDHILYAVETSRQRWY